LLGYAHSHSSPYLAARRVGRVGRNFVNSVRTQVETSGIPGSPLERHTRTSGLGKWAAKVLFFRIVKSLLFIVPPFLAQADATASGA
jgi:hypothetical protein